MRSVLHVMFMKVDVLCVRAPTPPWRKKKKIKADAGTSVIKCTHAHSASTSPDAHRDTYRCDEAASSAASSAAASSAAVAAPVLPEADGDAESPVCAARATFVATSSGVFPRIVWQCAELLAIPWQVPGVVMRAGQAIVDPYGGTPHHMCLSLCHCFVCPGLHDVTRA